MHVVVTEHGVADLRGTDGPERRRRLIAVAAPEFRERLAEGRPPVPESDRGPG